MHQVVGAIWYLIAIERQDTCWARKHISCGFNLIDLYCGAHGRRNNITTADHVCLNGACPLTKPDDIVNSTTFNFGIFIDVLQSQVAERKAFINKLSYCFWWGLRNLRFVQLNCTMFNSYGCSYLDLNQLFLIFQFSGTKPQNKHFHRGDILCCVYLNLWIGFILIAHWKYAGKF